MPSEEVRRLLKLFGVAMTEFEDAVHQRAAPNEVRKREAEVRALHARWDKRDPEVVKLWEETRQWSLDGFNELYNLLGIRFDRYYFPSQAEHPGKAVVNELIERGIAQDADVLWRLSENAGACTGPPVDTVPYLALSVDTGTVRGLAPDADPVQAFAIYAGAFCGSVATHAWNAGWNSSRNRSS